MKLETANSARSLGDTKSSRAPLLFRAAGCQPQTAVFVSTSYRVEFVLQNSCQNQCATGIQTGNETLPLGYEQGGDEIGTDKVVFLLRAPWHFRHIFATN